MAANVYILRCSDGSYYTGITQKDLESRFSEHQQGVHDGYTAATQTRDLGIQLRFRTDYRCNCL